MARNTVPIPLSFVGRTWANGADSTLRSKTTKGLAEAREQSN